MCLFVSLFTCNKISGRSRYKTGATAQVGYQGFRLLLVFGSTGIGAWLSFSWWKDS